MKKTLLFILISITALSLTTMHAYAHVLKTDGDIGVILHINPDDNPISKIPTQFILYFDDYTNRLNLKKCSCFIKISENNQIINTSKINVTNNLISVNTFTFPRPDVYYLTAYGSPTQHNLFQSFSVIYEVRVGGINKQSFPILLGVGIGMLIAIILLAAYVMEYSSTP